MAKQKGIFGYLSELSGDVIRGTIMKHISDRHKNLSREEGLRDIESELKELMRVNESVGTGVIAAVDSVFPFVTMFANLYQSEEVKDFWKTVSPQMRLLLIEGILALLRGIDQALWAHEMTKINEGGK